MERTRIYYRALGYTNDYVWAYHADVPFARPVKPIGAMKVALISTAGPGDRSHRDERNRRHAWSGLVASPPETFDTDMAWEKESTHTDDRETREEERRVGKECVRRGRSWRAPNP